MEKAPPSGKELILASTMPRKMKNRATRAKHVILDKSWTPSTQGSSLSDTSSSESFISEKEMHPPSLPRNHSPPSPLHLDSLMWLHVELVGLGSSSSMESFAS